MKKPLVFADLLKQVHHNTLDWKPFHPGVSIARLYKEDDGHTAALLRYEPGATVPQHVHPGYEHLFILSGDQVDQVGEHPAGTLLVNPPGSAHQVTSPSGCLVLAIWEQPPRFS
jgi:anti-sigma factor ChrR (cupin superfamily)